MNRLYIIFTFHFLISLSGYHINVGHKLKYTCEQRAASSWNDPPTKLQYSSVVILHWPRIPIQHGWPIISHIICSAIPWCPGCPWGNNPWYGPLIWLLLPTSFPDLFPGVIFPACLYRYLSISVFLRQIGHFVISSGQIYGATEAGASQYLQFNVSLSLIKLFVG